MKQISFIIVAFLVRTVCGQQNDPVVPYRDNNNVVKQVYYENNNVGRPGANREENPFGNIIMGIATLSVSSALLWWNEGRAVRDAEMLRRAKATVMPFDENDGATEGTLVHVQGPLLTDGLRDAEFGITRPDALRLKRLTEGFQWIEEKHEERTQINHQTTRVEVTYQYRKGWTSTVMDSLKFEAPTGHQNPEPRMRLGTLSWIVVDAQVKGLYVPPSLVSKIGNSRQLHLPSTRFAAAIESTSLIAQDKLYFLPDKQQDSPQDPKENTLAMSGPKTAVLAPTPSVGDIRVSWEEVTMQEPEVSILALQKDGKLIPWTDERTGHELFDIKEGNVSALDMVSNLLQKSRSLTSILRAVGGLGNYIGFTACFSFLPAIASRIPLVSGILGPLVGLATSITAIGISLGLTAAVVSIAWLRFRPLLSIGLGILSGIGFFGPFYYAKANRKPEVEELDRVLGGLSDDDEVAQSSI